MLYLKRYIRSWFTRIELPKVTPFQGVNLLIPIIDQIKYVQSLKELAVEIPQQSAITVGKAIRISLFTALNLPPVYLLTAIWNGQCLDKQKICARAHL